VHVVGLYCIVILKCIVQKKTLNLLNFCAIVNLSISYYLFIYLAKVLVADARRRLVAE
jgi:hypothetical protein